MVKSIYFILEMSIIDPRRAVLGIEKNCHKFQKTGSRVLVFKIQNMIDFKSKECRQRASLRVKFSKTDRRPSKMHEIWSNLLQIDSGALSNTPRE